MWEAPNEGNETKAPAMAPAEPTAVAAEPSIIVNMKRSATLPIIFMFFVNPFLGCFLFWYFVIRPFGTENHISQPFFWVVYGYALSAFIVGPLWAFHNEVKRLERLGIKLQPQRISGRRWDWALNVAICVVVCWWGTKAHKKRADEAEDFATWFRLILMILAMWLGVVSFFLGQIWYFAAEAPPAAQQEGRVQM